MKLNMNIYQPYQKRAVPCQSQNPPSAPSTNQNSKGKNHQLCPKKQKTKQIKTKVPKHTVKRCGNPVKRHSYRAVKENTLPWFTHTPLKPVSYHRAAKLPHTSTRTKETLSWPQFNPIIEGFAIDVQTLLEYF